MSADNWEHCPRCAKIAADRLETREAKVSALYGAVPVDEFDEARRQLAAEMADFERREKTFREDYGIFGANTGVVTVSYSGSCEKCGLELRFRDEHPIPGWKDRR